ncbi:hypothetical protein PYW07_015389 [Mythimna separata]|uniref:DUF4795 domain-containing protein n=1 Tax=Mythimna separata TaxID=271217 RepID=A0AAD7YX87_MYTSE|nr:hypothetical protein PYW07_015389 [Mythimna separata]
MSMSSEHAPAPEIMNVRQIIEYAFGDFERNAVNFRLVQTVLFLIARQLRLLERRVELQFGPLVPLILPSESTLSVTEVKIHAMQKKKITGKKKTRGARTGASKFAKGKAGGSTSTGTDKTSTDKTSSDKTSTEKTSSDKTSTEKTSTDKTSSMDKTTSTDISGKKTSFIEKETTTSTDITYSGKTTTTPDKTSTDVTTLTDLTYSGRTTTSGEKTSTDYTTSTFTSTGQTTTSGEKTSADVTTSTFTSSGKTATSGEKTSADVTTSTFTSSGKTTTSGEKTSTDATTSTFTSSGITGSSAEKTTTDKSTSTGKGSSSRTTSFDIQKPGHYHDKLTAWEEQRERELRIIHQRADSHEEGKKTPTPMASLSSIPEEAQYEKLLVVKTVPSKEARAGETIDGQKRTPEISVVTQEQFEGLADIVRLLQKKFLPGSPEFPKHDELMEALRRGASLTDAMSVLQLSARLDATEKALGTMMSMVTELAVATPGLELDRESRAYLGLDAKPEKKRHEFVPGKRTKGKEKGGKTSPGFGVPSTQIETSDTVAGGTETETTPGQSSKSPEADESKLDNYVTFYDLQNAATDLYEDIMKQTQTLTSRTNYTAETAYKVSTKLEAKLDASVDVFVKMAVLENAVKQYAEQINLLDTGLSTQMTNYQEQLTQMQHDLEVGLDNMAEVFGNTGGDIEAVTELHSHFADLQTELENMAFRQKQFRDAQESTSYDLETIWKEIEGLRDLKSNRDEVADALRDKAGIADLNGLVSIQQFEAVRGDLEKRIAAAYDTFNNQEYVWQGAIDDMLKILYDKADVIQLHGLNDEIQKNLNILRERIKLVADIVGEPKSAATSKRVFRDSACIACGTPAHMDMEEPVKVPALPKIHSAKHPTEASEAESRTIGGGDSRPCYPDLPIPHPIDPRSHICKRYCGGSHTVITEGLNRAPPSLVVNKPQRPGHTAPGTDGKLYMVDEKSTKLPCLPCNINKPTPVPAPAPESPLPGSFHSTMEVKNLSLTPPAQDTSYKSYY